MTMMWTFEKDIRRLAKIVKINLEFGHYEPTPSLIELKSYEGDPIADIYLGKLREIMDMNFIPYTHNGKKFNLPLDFEEEAPKDAKSFECPSCGRRKKAKIPTGTIVKCKICHVQLREILC